MASQNEDSLLARLRAYGFDPKYSTPMACTIVGVKEPDFEQAARTLVEGLDYSVVEAFLSTPRADGNEITVLLRSGKLSGVIGLRAVCAEKPSFLTELWPSLRSPWITEGIS